MDFWASWNKESIATQDSLVSVQKALKKDKFVIISLSLDLDKKEWMEKIIQRDTTQWKQVCDFKGWNNSIVKQQGHHTRYTGQRTDRQSETADRTR